MKETPPTPSNIQSRFRASTRGTSEGLRLEGNSAGLVVFKSLLFRDTPDLSGQLYYSQMVTAVKGINRSSHSNRTEYGGRKSVIDVH